MINNIYITKIFLAGAFIGGVSSGLYKMYDIAKEPEYTYINSFIEVPIRIVYHISRIAGHTVWGALIGGTAALTSPISMPIYYYYYIYPKDKLE